MAFFTTWEQDEYFKRKIREDDEKKRAALIKEIDDLNSQKVYIPLSPSAKIASIIFSILLDVAAVALFLSNNFTFALLSVAISGVLMFQAILGKQVNAPLSSSVSHTDS